MPGEPPVELTVLLDQTTRRVHCSNRLDSVIALVSRTRHIPLNYLTVC